MPNYTQEQVGKKIAETIRARITKFEGEVKSLRERELRKSAPAADVCPLCAEPDVGGQCACTRAHTAKKNDDGAPMAMSELCKSCGMSKCGCAPTAKAMSGEGSLGNWDEKRKECKECGKTHVKVRQDGGLVTHDAPGGKVCNGKRVIKDELPAAAKPKKPKTPQVPAMPGTSPLGIKPVTKDELASDKKAAGVGPINAITSKFKKPAAPAADTGKGPVRGARGMGVAGMAALARGEKQAVKKGEIAEAGKKVQSADDASKPKTASLKKDAMSAMIGKEPFKPAGSMGAPKLPGMTSAGAKGTAGKQPAGMGGGDAHKGAPGMHPDTAAGLADVKGVSPAGKWKSQGLPGLKSKLGDVAASKIPITEAPMASKGAPAAPASNPAADLKADKKAAGIGFLSNLLSRFRKPAPAAPVGSGPVRSQASPYAGVRGMAALARSEACGMTLLKSLGDCALCGKSEHLGRCPR